MTISPRQLLLHSGKKDVQVVSIVYIAGAEIYWKSAQGELSCPFLCMAPMMQMLACTNCHAQQNGHAPCYQLRSPKVHKWDQIAACPENIPWPEQSLHASKVQNSESADGVKVQSIKGKQTLLPFLWSWCTQMGCGCRLSRKWTRPKLSPQASNPRRQLTPSPYSMHQVFSLLTPSIQPSGLQFSSSFSLPVSMSHSCTCRAGLSNYKSINWYSVASSAGRLK